MSGCETPRQAVLLLAADGAGTATPGHQAPQHGRTAQEQPRQDTRLRNTEGQTFTLDGTSPAELSVEKRHPPASGCYVSIISLALISGL